MDEIIELTLADFEERAEKTMEHLQGVLSGIRTGRASPALIENVRVEAYGSMTPLNQLAHISVPEARQLVVKPFDGSLLKEIERALYGADLGLAPSSDGKLIRLSLPPLSGEQRQKLVGKVKELAEETRIALRNERRDANKHAEQAQRDHSITEDHLKNLKDRIQDRLRDFEKRVDELVAKKSEEVLND